MASGPEHYLIAEQLLDRAAEDVSANMAYSTGEYKADLIAAAQVHATLAQVAALCARPLSEWQDVLGDEPR